MADTLNTTPILSVIATNASRLSDLSIKNGQLVFIKDKSRIAFDFDDKRVFYNQIVELSTDDDRQSLLAPISGKYYFVISTAVLWYYSDKWVQITTPPQEIVFIGVELPELGSANTLYVNKQEQNISVWDEDESKYKVVADTTDRIPDDLIDGIFVSTN